MVTSTTTVEHSAGLHAPAEPSEALPSRAVTAFVWGVWALMTLVALRFAWRYGSNVPFWEEWLWVPYAVGETPISLSWLWEQIQDHRAPIYKLLISGSFRAFGLDERPILLLDVGLLALLAAAMMWAVRRVRGCWSIADAFFPLALLNLGHAETFYWAGTNVYVLATFLSGMILVTLYATGSRLTPRPAAFIGCCLVLLTLTFGGGLLYAACLAAGLGPAGLLLLRSPDPSVRRTGQILVGSAGATVLMVALYFVGYQKSRFAPVGDLPITPATVAKMTLRFLTSVFGWGSFDPLGRYTRWITAAALSIGVGALAVALVRHRRGGALPLLGLGLYFASCLAVALVVGYGRAPWGPESVERSRYGAAAVPTWLCLYLVWEACGPSRIRALGRATLCLLIFAFVSLNTFEGLEAGAEHRGALEAFRADVRAGKSIPYLASRHAARTYYVQDWLEGFLRLLRDRRYGEYADLPPDRTFREIPLTSRPSEVLDLVWDGEKGRTTSRFAHMTFELPRPMEVVGIRLKYTGENPGGWEPILTTLCRTNDEEHGTGWKAHERIFLKSAVPEVVTFRFCEKIDRIQIRPDVRPCDFTISDLVLLVEDPPTAAADGRRPTPGVIR